MSKKIYPIPHIREEVEVEIEGGVLKGVLEMPCKKTDLPVLLMIAGSGPTDRDGNSLKLAKPNDSLKMLGGWLTDLGMAVLRYDKRGVGESSPGTEKEKTTFDHMVGDALSWLDFLKDDGRFTSYGLIGHSEGSLVALKAALEEQADFFISLAGAGRPICRIIREQLRSQPVMIRKKAYRILDKLERGERVEKIPFYLKPLFAPELQNYVISWNAYDPAQLISHYDKPALIIQGSTDLQTSLLDSKLLAEAGRNTRLEIIEGMNHILKDAPASRIKNLKVYTKQGVPLSRGLIDTLDDFLAEVTNSERSKQCLEF